MPASKNAVIAILIVAGVYAQSVGPSAPPKGAKATPSAFEIDAKARGQRYWARLLRECPNAPNGVSHFYYFESQRWRVTNGVITANGARVNSDDLMLVEMKGVSIDTGPRSDFPLVEADRLNGVTYRASSGVRARALRTRRMGQNGHWEPWSEWQDPRGHSLDLPTSISFQRKNGQWEPADHSDFSTTEELPEMPSCDVLQGSAPSPLPDYEQLDQSLITQGWTDATTHLSWNFTFSGSHWDKAVTRCEGLTSDGHNDWRLPEIKELKTLMADLPLPVIQFLEQKPVFGFWSSEDHLEVDLKGTGPYRAAPLGNMSTLCVR